MKITMSISEMASLAGVAKQINEIVDPNGKKMSVQEMIIKMINNYKDPEKESFCTIKIDHKMNLVIECEPEAISKILDIFKDFILSMYPLYKAVYECGLNFGNRIQEVVDEYKELNEQKHSGPTPVVIIKKGTSNRYYDNVSKAQEAVDRARRQLERATSESFKENFQDIDEETTKDNSESSFSSELDSNFADIFEDVFKDKEEKSSEEKDNKEEPQKKKSRKSSEVKKNKRYVYCTECGRSSSEELTEDEIKEYTCKHCGSKTFV